MYFENMTSFSLFHRPSFTAKMLAISSTKQRHALLAGMFSFSSRFYHGKAITDGWSQLTPEVPSTERFHQLALNLIDEIIPECDEEAPSLCVLQAMILTTFYQLTNGVRGRAWRLLGNCVRVAYELQLHQVDLQNTHIMENQIENFDSVSWRVTEERRRAWWTIWEFDVFASTIRCLPTAIDWTSNLTNLPMDDASWYNISPCTSCRLAVEPSMRWKLLEKSGNRSPTAWFIVVNSLMRTAEVLSNSQVLFYTALDGSYCWPSTDGSMKESSDVAQSERNILENSLSCFTMGLPAELAYQDEFLNFNTKGIEQAAAACSKDSAKYSIHMMTQLTRLMIHRHQVSWHVDRILKLADVSEEQSNLQSPGHQSPFTSLATEHRAWNHYLNSADSIIALIRGTSSNHVRHVNPFLANTIWLAAAAQVLGMLFRPQTIDRRTAESNIDLLRSTFNRYASFWNISPSLKDKLDSLETRLQGLKSRNIGHSGAAWDYQGRQDRYLPTVGSSFMEQQHSTPSRQDDFESPLGGLLNPGVGPQAADRERRPAQQASLVPPDPLDASVNELFEIFGNDFNDLFVYGHV
jgi:hypothetical protein